MKKLAALFLILLLISPAALAEREFIDMAGRAVVLPDEPTRVFGLDPIAGIFLIAAAPDALTGWNYPFNENEFCYLPQSVMELDSFGMGDCVNYESVLASGTQMLVYAGDLTPSAVEQADAAQQKSGLPVLCLSSALADIPEALSLLANIFSTDLSDHIAYAERVLSSPQLIPKTERVRVYYGNGEDSLQTAPAGSTSAEVFELVGGENVADLPGDARAYISPEQLLAWDPQIILVNGEPKKSLSSFGAAKDLLANPLYQQLSAVKNARVHAVPNLPFSWLDRPMSLNRLLGILWAEKTLYPQTYAQIDLDREVLDFYRLFYHLDMTEDDVVLLLSRF